MQLKKKVRTAAVFALASCMFFSCSRNRGIDSSSLNQESLVPGVQWAVVQDPYVAFRENPGFEETVASHARRGEVFEITGKTTVTSGKGASKRIDTWYRFEPGWLEANAVMVYDNRLKADREANLLKD